MGLSASAKLFRSFVKPGKYILSSEGRLGCMSPWKLSAKELKTGKITQETEAFIGDLSFEVAEKAASKFPEAFSDIQYMFETLPGIKKVIGRPKSALSAFTKIKRKILKNGGIKGLDEAVSFVGDASGSRVIINSLPKLSSNNISELINKTTINGKSLTNRQVNLLKKFIYEEAIDKKYQEEAFQLYKEFSKPLVEQHSQMVIDNLTMSSLAYRIKQNEITLADVKSHNLLEPELIAEFETRLAQGDIAPIKIIEVNNYRGAHGIAEFTDAQMTQLNYAMGFKNKGGMIVKRKATSARYNYINENNTLKNEFAYNEPEKAIKASGYRTGQMNVQHANGALGEVQFRGEYTNEWAECEHIAYDLRRGKNTLGKVYDDYAKVVSSLSDSDYAIYNQYLEKCYNYYHRMELGLPAKKPQLPNSLNPILSMDSMRALHIKGEKAAKEAKQKFVPHNEPVHFSRVA